MLHHRRPMAGIGFVVLASSVQGIAGEPAPIGPDVVVAQLTSLNNYGSENGISAFSVGTTSCNFGDENINWFRFTNEHPVIGQNMYRLKDNRFEQIGMSWVKHGFAALTGNVCGLGCISPGTSALLGVGCSDPYSASLNGDQGLLGPRSQVNAHTGLFVYPPDIPNRGCDVPFCPTIERRLQVHDEDLDPALNPPDTTRYFVEGAYVTLDDAQAGNGNNNAAYREIEFVDPSSLLRCSSLEPDEFCAKVLGPTVMLLPAIRAWRDLDPSVVETEIQVFDDGLLIVAAKVFDVGDGFWQYEYAIFNLNSDRSVGSFSVPIPAGTLVTDLGFHDVDYHSGEPYDGTDWPATVSPASITWATTSFDVNFNANALRWGTLYNFRFRANVQPADTSATIGLFKPGFPAQVPAVTRGPQLGIIDCNENGFSDGCDVDCSAVGCEVGCGGSEDCNSNGVPDECEEDCNDNLVPDSCDLSSGSSEDCNGNFVPDECEPDCDDDGIPDACDTFEDTDQDGVVDCFDDCPETTPAGACICPAVGCCFFFFAKDTCQAGYPRLACIDDGGLPECLEPCRDGCLTGDVDLDGDIDVLDVGGLMMCFSGVSHGAGFVKPSSECLLRYDFDNDLDVDLGDLKRFEAAMTGP